MTDEINVRMSMSSEVLFQQAVSALTVAGYHGTRGVGQAAFPIVLDVPRLADEHDKIVVEEVLRSVDPDCRPVDPPATPAE